MIVKRISFAFAMAGAAILITSCGSSGSAALTIPAEGIQLKMASAKGDKETFKVVTKMDVDMSGTPQAAKAPNGGKMNMTLTMTMDNECTDATAGKFTWKTKMTDVKVEGNIPNGDQQAAAMKGQEYTTIFDETGKIVKVEGASQMAGTGSSAGIELPKGKVKVGDSWETNSANNGMTVTMIFKVTGMENVNGEDCLAVDGSFKEGQMIKSTAPMKMWLSAKTGRVVKSAGDMEMDLGAKMKIKVSMDKVG